MVLIKIDVCFLDLVVIKLTTGCGCGHTVSRIINLFV